MVLIAGLIVNGIMLVIIIFLVVMIIMHSTDLNQCENNQSPFCYTIQCPCDDPTKGPCNGYAIRNSSDGNFYCSMAPLSKVDSNGNNVK